MNKCFMQFQHKIHQAQCCSQYSLASGYATHSTGVQNIRVSCVLGWGTKCGCILGSGGPEFSRHHACDMSHVTSEGDFTECWCVHLIPDSHAWAIFQISLKKLGGPTFSPWH